MDDEPVIFDKLITGKGETCYGFYRKPVMEFPRPQISDNQFRIAFLVPTYWFATGRFLSFHRIFAPFFQGWPWTSA
jgi:hypothetical protein